MDVAVGALSVHTANLSPDTDEKLVIVTTTPEALAALQTMRGPIRLLGPEGARPVTFAPVRRAEAPVLDPGRGWVIPVSPAAAAEIQALPPGPGTHELTTFHLGFVIE